MFVVLQLIYWNWSPFEEAKESSVFLEGSKTQGLGKYEIQMTALTSSLAQSFQYFMANGAKSVNKRLRGETRFMNGNVQRKNCVNCVQTILVSTAWGSSLACRDYLRALQLGLVWWYRTIRRDLQDLRHT